MSNNEIGGELPISLSNYDSVNVETKGIKMTVMKIPKSLLTCPIPKSMGNLTNMLSLDLSSNMLTGVIPAELTNLDFLEVLIFPITILWKKYLKDNSLIHLQLIPKSENQRLWWLMTNILTEDLYLKWIILQMKEKKITQVSEMDNSSVEGEENLYLKWIILQMKEKKITQVSELTKMYLTI
ncbi:hypothetical protein KIW84_020196 [Lathyrus oleraceus]|uniref:Uncharacterized protein n=1 Tax=Pisum sativum TaxID=3888 RepID=A0A9D4Y517_PEA|nr:hypothetical protein KIW84_020196 [Pisum sativum]